MEISLYFKTHSCWIAYWKQKSVYYQHGFVLRFLWFGLCIRYGRVYNNKIYPDYLDLYNMEDYH